MLALPVLDEHQVLGVWILQHRQTECTVRPDEPLTSCSSRQSVMPLEVVNVLPPQVLTSTSPVSGSSLIPPPPSQNQLFLLFLGALDQLLQAEIARQVKVPSTDDEAEQDDWSERGPAVEQCASSLTTSSTVQPVSSLPAAQQCASSLPSPSSSSQAPSEQ